MRFEDILLNYIIYEFKYIEILVWVIYKPFKLNLNFKKKFTIFDKDKDFLHHSQTELF